MLVLNNLIKSKNGSQLGSRKFRWDWKNIVGEYFAITVAKIAGVWGNGKNVERNLAKHGIKILSQSE